jgi:hypothetical protein
VLIATRRMRPRRVEVRFALGMSPPAATARSVS